MRNMLKKSVILAAGAVLMSLSLPLRGEIIYNNSVTDLHYRFDPGTTEIGDEIILGGTARYLTLFSFEFWGTNTAQPDNSSFAGAVEVRVRLYKNDGPPDPKGWITPGTMFWDSGWYGGFAPTPRSTLVYTEAAGDFPTGGLSMPIISNMTWSVQFQGMGATDSLGVDIYCPAVVGTNYNDYWVNDPTWILMENTNAPGAPFPGYPGQMNFGALMEAVPEPAAMVISLVGGLGMWGLTRRLRRKE